MGLMTCCQQHQTKEMCFSSYQCNKKVWFVIFGQRRMMMCATMLPLRMIKEHLCLCHGICDTVFETQVYNSILTTEQLHRISQEKGRSTTLEEVIQQCTFRVPLLRILKVLEVQITVNTQTALPPPWNRPTIEFEHIPA